jgi:hypothetical protein
MNLLLEAVVLLLICVVGASTCIIGCRSIFGNNVTVKLIYWEAPMITVVYGAGYFCGRLGGLVICWLAVLPSSLGLQRSSEHL